MKTKKAAAKRFRVGGTKRVKFKRVGKKHLLSHRSSKNKRSLRRQGTLPSTHNTHVRRMLPFAF